VHVNSVIWYLVQDTGEPECRYDRKALFPGGSCYPMSKDRGKDKSGKEKKDQLAGSTLSESCLSDTDEINHCYVSAVIFDVLGTPTEDEIRRTRTDASREYLMSLKPKRPDDLMKRFPTAGMCQKLQRVALYHSIIICSFVGKDAIDLLRRLLRFHAEDRISIDEALAHPFLAPVRRPHDETVRKDGAIHFRKVTPENIRDLFVDEIRCYNAQIPDNWKELASAGLYEWRALMESTGGIVSPDDDVPYAASAGSY
jgi:mitogen-activated protein kinase 1/3